MMLKLTEKTTSVKTLDNLNKEIILEDVPIYIEEETGEELVNFADILRADERRIAKEFGINIYNIFELALLYVDVKQRTNGIRQKFRFNKMLFYVSKKLEEEYGENTLIFDEMGKARAGPIPIHLKDDLIELQNDKFVEIRIIKDGKPIHGSKKDWEKYKNIGSIECTLTKKGYKLGKKIWYELDPEMQEIILDIKRELFYMDTERLKIKVHKEYPEYKMSYGENDTESFEEFLV